MSASSRKSVRNPRRKRRARSCVIRGMIAPVSRGPVVIGMLGCGTVGGGVLQVLDAHAEDIQERLGVPLKVKRVAVKSKDKPPDVKVEKGVMTDDVDSVLEDPAIHVVVELIGGT